MKIAEYESFHFIAASAPVWEPILQLPSVAGHDAGTLIKAFQRRALKHYINFGKIMQALTFNQAIQSFATLMDDVSNNHEPLIITHEHHRSVVLMSLDDFNAWQETDYLTRSTANANDLLQAVNDIKERKNIVKRSLIEEND